jgi:hypothetical protein
MSRRFSSIAVSIGVLLIAAGAHAAPSTGPIDKGWVLERPTDGQNAKKKKPKKDVEAEEAAEAEEEEAAEKKKKGKKGKKGKKDAEEAEEAEEKPKKKGKKAKKEELEEEPEEEEKPKKKGKKGKKEEPPPEEEIDLKETEAPTAEGEPEETEEPLEEQSAEESSEEPKEEAKVEESASVSSADLEGKVVLGLRLGFGLFLGSTTGDAEAIAFSNKIPIWIDAGYKFTPNLMIGLYGQYAPAGVKDCFSNAECSASVMRFGAQVQYEFSPEGPIDPWVGLGIGYEIASATITVTEPVDPLDPSLGNITREAEFEFKGFEFANLQAGFDYKVSPGFGIGPFLSFSLGRYASGEQTASAAGVSATRSGGVTNKTMHEWFVIGVRGNLAL